MSARITIVIRPALVIPLSKTSFCDRCVIDYRHRRVVFVFEISSPLHGKPTRSNRLVFWIFKIAIEPVTPVPGYTFLE